MGAKTWEVAGNAGLTPDPPAGAAMNSPRGRGGARERSSYQIWRARVSYPQRLGAFGRRWTMKRTAWAIFIAPLKYLRPVCKQRSQHVNFMQVISSGFSRTN